jgi:hypothetical protein
MLLNHTNCRIVVEICAIRAVSPQRRAVRVPQVRSEAPAAMRERHQTST